MTHVTGLGHSYTISTGGGAVLDLLRCTLLGGPLSDARQAHNRTMRIGRSS